MLCKTCKLDKKQRFFGEKDNCKWCEKYFPPKDSENYEFLMVRFNRRLRVKKSKRDVDIKRYNKVNEALEGKTKINSTGKPVAWCDCIVVELTSFSGDFRITEVDKDDYCKSCGHVAQYSIKKPSLEKKLEKFVYNQGRNEKYKNQRVKLGKHLQCNNWLQDHTIHMPKFKEYGDEVFQIQEVRELSETEIEYININYNKES